MRALEALQMTEAQLAEAVRQAAVLGKWLHYHTYMSQRSTPGFPDLVLVRERVIFAELKTSKGRLRPDQMLWLGRLREAGATAEVWRPEDLDRVVAMLTARPDGGGYRVDG